MIIIPIRSFRSAKLRLATTLDPIHRARLACAMAERTVGAARVASGTVAVVTAAAEVASWADDLGVRVITDQANGLDEAAKTATSVADRAGLPWLLVHSDLPAITGEVLAEAIELCPQGGYLLSPSFDGGTSVFAGWGEMEFAYGPASFRRHLAAVGSSPHQVVVRLRLALDLDTPADLAFFVGWPPTGWIKDLVSAP